MNAFKQWFSPESHLLSLAQFDPMSSRPTLAQRLGRFYAFIVLLVSLGIPIFSQFFALPFTLVYYYLDTAWKQAGHTSPLIPTSLSWTILLILSFAPIYFIVWGWLYLFERRHLWTLGFERSGALKKYGRGLLFGFLLMTVALAMANISGFFTDLRSGIERLSLQTLAGVLVIFIGWIVQGAGEEILTRGFLMQVIGRRWGVFAGVLVSSLAFSFLHLLNPNLSLLAVVNLFLYGLFAAFYALHEGGLWGVCALHSIWNWAEGNLYGQSVSGGIMGNVSLVTVHLSGPAWWNGGEFGPEGGLIVTLVLVAGIFLVWLYSQKQSF